MYLDKSKITIKGKTYSRYLLRESYREGNKVKHRTIANLTKSRPEEIRAIEIALRHKHELSKLSDALKAVEYKQGQSVGAVWVVYKVACELGIDKALGDSEQGSRVMASNSEGNRSGVKVICSKVSGVSCML